MSGSLTVAAEGVVDQPRGTPRSVRFRWGRAPGRSLRRRAAWVVNTTDATLQRINATTFTRGPPVAVGGSPSAVAFGGGWVWVVDSGSSTVLKIDPRTMQVVSRSPVGNDPARLLVGGRLWVANAADGTVTRLDPATQQGQPIPVGSAPSSVATSTAPPG